MKSETMHSQDPVDEKFGLGKMSILGFQHVMVMYAGAITIPLIVGGALGLSREDMALLINADLLCCGIVSIIQCLGIGNFIGIKLPIMMGVAFAGVAPMIAIGHDYGLQGLYGAVIGGGLICFIAMPWIVKLLVLFPPIVTGTTLLSLGAGLLGIPTIWMGGGFGAQEFGSLTYLGISAAVILSIIIFMRYGRGFFSHISVLLGLIVGYAIAFGLGLVDFSGVAEAPYFGVVKPFHFGAPTFQLVPVLTMTMIVIVTLTESIGLFFSMAEILNRNLTRDEFLRGLRADAAGAVIGGVFNTFAYTSFAQNIGLVGLTGVRSRFVTAIAGVILIVLAFIPKIAAVVATIPQFVLGGATLVMFGLIALSGVSILSRVPWLEKPHNAFIAAVALGVGMMPAMSDKIWSHMPPAIGPILNSGVLLSATVAIVLNLIFNGLEVKDWRAAAVKGD
ncbi:MAG: purine permease [Comamonas sp. SCN 65-56]|uniref:nucleobase:cation symporter-2 family protein n=1 Tax=Comamonas sp. SCN 65-56 TaxID=1660095 RepID=UPI00086E12D5|nr:nucleobase:cation symporter-2 family protein [Comamonas sp. SCN 65-56]ODS91756.1 MAG: purine permease [Comamonas sp. SCN 65-56]